MKEEIYTDKASETDETANDENLTFGQEAEGQEAPEDNLTAGESAEKDDFQLLQEKYDDLNDKYLRLHAEFDNFRKRTMKEKADIIRSGGERVLADIISLVDDFERAQTSLHRSEDKKSILEGIDLIYGKFVGFLTQHGVKEIEAIGQSFDPEKFEAVTTVPVQDTEQSGKVIDCIQKGYSLNDKIIRFPKVIVGE
ncbi:MAG: nucleotide exchange factor GrpE [Dysgonamonadaceae bacterium]|jgi:molecular chaperone GrpE|nr:nucleotide exchange factor GrpE [Dysgonamonadaceae bacterium]